MQGSYQGGYRQRDSPPVATVPAAAADSPRAQEGAPTVSVFAGRRWLLRIKEQMGPGARGSGARTADCRPDSGGPARYPAGLVFVTVRCRRLQRDPHTRARAHHLTLLVPTRCGCWCTNLLWVQVVPTPWGMMPAVPAGMPPMWVRPGMMPVGPVPYPIAYQQVRMEGVAGLASTVRTSTVCDRLEVELCCGHQPGGSKATGLR